MACTPSSNEHWRSQQVVTDTAIHMCCTSSGFCVRASRLLKGLAHKQNHSHDQVPRFQADICMRSWRYVPAMMRLSLVFCPGGGQSQIKLSPADPNVHLQFKSQTPTVFMDLDHVNCPRSQLLWFAIFMARARAL